MFLGSGRSLSVWPATYARLLTGLEGAAGNSSRYAAAWAVTDWYLDGVTGSDANSGTTAALPLRTGAELLRRLGPYAIWRASVTIHIGAGGLSDALTVRGLRAAADVNVDVIGTPTAVLTDTVSAYSAYSHATPVETRITATTTADMTPYQGMRARITSGSTALGAVFWVAKVAPGGAANNVFSTNRGCRIDATNTSALFNTSHLQPSANDTFVIESLPQVPQITVALDGPVARGTTAQWPMRTFSIQSVDCPWVDCDCVADGCSVGPVVFGSKIGPVRTKQLVVQAYSLSRAGCNLAYPDARATGFAPLEGFAFCCVCTAAVAQYVLTGTAFRGIYLTFVNSGLVVQNGASAVLQDCQCFDTPAAIGAGIVVYGRLATSGGLSGTRNTSYGLGMLDGSAGNLKGTQNLHGTTSNYGIGSTLIQVDTGAKLCQPDDYAQSGQATLVAGTKTVTVPWWDPTRQRLTFSRATAGGTIGDLSAPSASRTNTQFVIQSANAADTSTVDWAISPLGRNVLIWTT